MTGSILDHSFEASPPPLSKTIVGVPLPLLCIHSAYPPTSTFRPSQSAIPLPHRNIVIVRTSVALSHKNSFRARLVEEIIQACTALPLILFRSFPQEQLGPHLIASFSCLPQGDRISIGIEGGYPQAKRIHLRFRLEKLDAACF